MKFWVSEMARWVKAFAVKPPEFIPETDVVEKENQPRKFSSDLHTHVRHTLT